ncbi:MAG: DUF5615 family PIN-like protein [Actinobacteria bacterium]|nr:DUF5615 family PIN-like protein [Actinomycetota bacterium]MCL5882924.1 DUF5615 family PIN-like protein [Actinomycetota bacterium]
MRFKIDENLPEDVALVLRNAGHDAITVLAQKLGGAEDQKIANICKDENRILVTLDAGFADIRTYPPSDYPGIIVLRLRHLDKISVVNVAKHLLIQLPTEQLSNRLWIVEETRVRVRGQDENPTL